MFSLVGRCNARELRFKLTSIKLMKNGSCYSSKKWLREGLIVSLELEPFKKKET